MKITASCPITSRQINGETVETVTDFIFLGSKFTAEGDCSHEIKRHLLLGRKAVTNLDSILKSRDFTLPTKVCLVKAMVFPVVMYEYESWAIGKAECWRTDAFDLWCWRRLLRVPWTARKSNQSILEEISPECSLEGLMLKLKLQYFGHLMWRTDSFEKTLMLGKIEGRRMRWLDGITDSMDIVWVSSGSWWWTGRPGVLQSMGVTESDATEQLDWTELLALFTHSSPSFFNHLYSYYLVFSQVNFLAPPHLVLLIGLYLFPSPETCSSVTSFCLTCCFYFYVSGRSVTFFLTWEQWPFVEDVFYAPVPHSLLVTRAICSSGAHCVGCVGPSVVTHWLLWTVWWMWLVPVWLVARA